MPGTAPTSGGVLGVCVRVGCEGVMQHVMQGVTAGKPHDRLFVFGRSLRCPVHTYKHTTRPRRHTHRSASPVVGKRQPLSDHARGRGPSGADGDTHRSGPGHVHASPEPQYRPDLADAVDIGDGVRKQLAAVRSTSTVGHQLLSTRALTL